MVFFFEHLLDQVDTPARAVELVAEQLVGRAGGGAEPAMDAGAQDLIGAGGAGVGKLFGGLDFSSYYIPLAGQASGLALEEAKKAAEKQPEVATDGKKLIRIEVFDKVDLKVAKITAADHVEGADKLLKFHMDESPRPHSASSTRVS